MAKQKLVRLRADPGLVRVTLRPCGELWIVEACDARRRMYSHAVVEVVTDKVILLLLEAAKKRGLVGVDLDCGYAYDHPQHGSAASRGR